MSVTKTDVLVIGGGMAAAWAAIAAAEAGAHVTVVDKGAMGTSGVTATGGPGHWWVGPAERRNAIARQTAKAAGLGEPAWMERILDLTWRHLPTIAPFYPFGSDGRGGRFINGVRGPEYMRALRAFATARGVEIRDHHPALELIADRDGRVVGARGQTLRDGQPWEVRSGAVVLATGGAAFRSGLIGSHDCTGEGHLMAVEAGANVSGMEFSISYSLSPAWASTRTLPFTGARFYDADGHEIDISPPRTGHVHYQDLGRAMLAGTVYADLIDAPRDLPPILRRIQPLTVAAFERRGIDLFRDRFPVRLFGEGTVRGSGGIDLVDDTCGTGVPGLYAAGDAATRELVAGASSGGGAVNSAWALSSGRIAGAAAAAQARRDSAYDGTSRGLGRAGLRPDGAGRGIDIAALIRRAGEAVHDYDKAFWRRESTLAASARVLDDDWRLIAAHGHATGRARVELRAAAAVVATARWVIASARERRETRGMHYRDDAQNADPAQAHRLLSGGLDDVWVRPVAPAKAEVAA
jgi:succinate dehydrogenase/fumarate reductase flavoprotein subunit